jgi:cysteine-rich repeat protein
VCGDGVVDSMEKCDDANVADGDGCSAACEIETTEPECFTILESLDTRQHSTHVTADGRVLIAGQAQTSGKWGAWVGAVDMEGTLSWSLDFGPGEEEDAVATGIRPRGDGFMFLHRDADENLVTIDASGNVVDTVTLDSDSVEIYDLLEVDAGVLLAGRDHGEVAWLGRLGTGGVLETLATVDYPGSWDALGSLRRHGELIGALAVVSLDSDGVSDNGVWDTLSTLLIEYDTQGIEQRRTVLTSGEDASVIGNHLDVSADGTWIVAGAKGHTLYPTIGWAAAVRAGEVLWTFESSGTVEVDPAMGPHASLSMGVAAQDVLLAGMVKTTLGIQPWAVRLGGTTGELEAEFVGAAPPPDWLSIYTGVGRTADGHVWLTGSTLAAQGESEVQWICKTSL